MSIDPAARQYTDRVWTGLAPSVAPILGPAVAHVSSAAFRDARKGVPPDDVGAAESARFTRVVNDLAATTPVGPDQERERAFFEGVLWFADTMLAAMREEAWQTVIGADEADHRSRVELQESRTLDARVLDRLSNATPADRGMRPSELVAEVGGDKYQVARALSRLAESGRIEAAPLSDGDDGRFRRWRIAELAGPACIRVFLADHDKLVGQFVPMGESGLEPLDVEVALLGESATAAIVMRDPTGEEVAA